MVRAGGEPLLGMSATRGDGAADAYTDEVILHCQVATTVSNDHISKTEPRGVNFTRAMNLETTLFGATMVPGSPSGSPHNSANSQNQGARLSCACSWVSHLHDTLICFSQSCRELETEWVAFQTIRMVNPGCIFLGCAALPDHCECLDSRDS